jgi:hypothetical protein
MKQEIQLKQKSLDDWTRMALQVESMIEKKQEEKDKC